MEKNQIYIKCGTNYKEMTKELLRGVCAGRYDRREK